ncbi:MAG: ThiF family adenylyltransferase [Terracidiphilus sp.]
MSEAPREHHADATIASWGAPDSALKRIITIDHDVIKDANLSRILYATREDAQLRRPKVKVLKRDNESLGLGCEIEPVAGSILDSTVLKRLNEADFIFGCVDKDFPRMILCQYAYQYHVPYIDAGAEVG